MINTSLVQIEPCKYSNKNEAVKYCFDCGAGLCSSCGYTSPDDNTRCNECHNLFIEEHCPRCLSAEYFVEEENTGYSYCPAYTAVKVVCAECGYYEVL